MTALTATVVAVTGNAFARNIDGNLRPLKPGDTLQESESVITSAGGRVEIAMPDGETFGVDENATFKLSADLSEASRPDAQDAHLADGTIDQVIDAINQGASLDDVIEAPAAGLAGGGGGEGSSFVRLLRISEDVNPADFEFDSAATREVEAVETGAATSVQVEVAPPPYVGNVTLSAPETASEGGAIVYVATVDNPPAGMPLVLTLSNGAEIIILPGENSGSVQVAAPGDDVYLDAETLIVTIEGSAGGGYDKLAVSGSVSSHVADTLDATTVSLAVSPAAITEAGGTVTYTATLTHAAEGAVSVKLSNGQTITIADGATSGTVEYTFAASDDVYIDPASVGVTITGASGGNFEQLTVNPAPAVVAIGDTTDPTTVSISAADVTENEPGVTFTIQVDHPPQGAASAQVQVGATTYDVALDGAGVGTLFLETADPDVYLDAGSVTATVTGVTGGNYEAVSVAGASATAQIADTLDETTVSLAVDPASITEAGGTVTYTATLTHAAEGAVSVKLSNGQTITIADGATSGTVEYTFAASDDVYVDPASAEVTITSASGGNFEQLAVNPAPAVVAIGDTTDPTTVSISAADVTEDDLGVTFTIQLDHPPQGAASAQVQVGATTYDVALDGAGVGTLFLETADPDVYLDAGSVTATVTGVTGGNYEAVSVAGASATAQIADTLDETTVSLAVDPASITEAGGTVTYTATLTHAAEGAVSVKLSNGQTITIADGATAGSVDYAFAASDDVYVDPASAEVTITSASGGNFEQLAVNPAPAVVAIGDTTDPTTVSISAADVTEDDLGVTFTIQLDHPPQGAASAQVQVGATTYNVALDAAGVGTLFLETADPDVYLDAGSVTATVTGVTGGNYEAVSVAGASATAQIADTLDETTVSLAVDPASITEAGGTVTYTATLTHAAEGAVSVKLSNGQTITIADGATSGTVEYTFAASDDVYVDPASAEVTITSASGGNFEQLAVNPAPAVVAIGDTTDPTTVSISAADVTEDDLGVTFTIQLDHPPQGAASAQVQVGATTYNVALDAAGVGTLFLETADPDVYLDAGSVTATVTGVTGGNYEAVSVAGASATAQIADTLDETTVSLAVDPASITEAGGTVTYTATLTHAAEGAVSVKLSNGQTITIADGATSGTVEYTFAASDDVYVDPASAEVTITSASGGNFEQLAVNPAPAVVAIGDTTDPTTVTLNATAEISETGGIIVYTATVDHAPQATPLVLTLSNGRQITIPVDGGTGSVSVSLSAAELAAFTDGTIPVSVTAAAGGNFEQLDLSDGATTRIDKGVEISDLASQIDGGDAVVSEANLPNGTSPNAPALTQAGSFTINAPDGIGSLKVAGFEVIANNVFTAVSFTTAFGNTLAFTSYDAATGVLNYTYTLAETVDHGVPGRDSVFEDFTVELVDNDASMPEVSSATLAVRVIDDAPLAFKPDTSYLVDQEPYTRTVSAELNFDSVGADGLGSVWFSGFTPGAIATDAFGNPLTLNGQGLRLYYGDDQSVLLAKTADGSVGIEVHLDAAANTYTLTTHGVIANGVKISTVDLTGVGGGNPALKALIDIGGSTKDVVLTTKSGDSINTNSTEIGISDGQSFKTGELIRYDFVNGAQVAGSGANKIFTGYDGTHNQVSEFRQAITKANGSVNLTVTAILTDSDNVFYGDTDEGELDLAASDIRVLNASGVDVTDLVTVADSGNSVTISGMQERWSFVVSSPVAFTALQVEGAAGTGTFKLGFFSTVQVLPGQPIDLAFGVTGSDADGDTASGSIHTTLYPASLSIEGDGDANTLTGGAGTDYVFGYDGADVLNGEGGNDVLVGGAGNDTLIGGAGSDLLVGGLGADIFRWTLAEAGTDTVKDFTLGKYGDATSPNADQLDLRDLLVGENSATLENFLHVTQAGGSTTVEISSNGGFAQGYNAGAVSQTVVLEGVSFEGLNSSSEIIAKLLTDGQIKTD